ncbi:MAG: hypothetical protein COB71_08390 [Thiotrichales bacterium]|nr:MAG: hypothetical protein COB71_08390 [Thiotrichales bacterium]
MAAALSCGGRHRAKINRHPKHILKEQRNDQTGASRMMLSQTDQWQLITKRSDDYHSKRAHFT